MKDYRLTEEEYFEYYQNSCDPTFQFYPFPERTDERTQEEIRWDEIPGGLDIFFNKNYKGNDQDKK